MKRNKNNKISYVLVPLVFTVVMGAVFALGIYPASNSMVAEWKSMWIQGAPEYAYAKVNENTKADEVTESAKRTQLTAGAQYGEILCEEAALNVPLYYGDNEDILELGAGTYTGYGVPGSGELVLVGAHDTTYFAALEQMEVGNIITVKTTYGDYTYEVRDIQVADVTDAMAELTAEEEELVLYTCYPFGATDEQRSERYMVYARPQNAADIGE